MPELGLVRGDRVENTMITPDIADLGKSRQFPVEITFWRPSLETSARHRCPLFSYATCVSPTNLGIDWLHTLILVVFQIWLGAFCH